jgi:WD40 repeat protein/serine/threonine protein kinase/TPR repeat protein
MSVASWERVKELLHQAVSLEPEARAKFLDEVCAANADLRAELDSLLSAEAQLTDDFMRSPLAGALDHDRDYGDFGATRLEAGQLFAQRFLLIRKLGEGGMGQVWLAEQAAPVRRIVALKLIGAGMYDETTVQRFQAERQSIAIMDHPCIAKVFDAGTSPQGQPYFVMEFVPGLPITEYCDQKRLGIAGRLEIFIRACEGVQHAHQKAIIHRDLKPANILVVEVDGIAVPRIIDFGLAKAITRQRTEETLFTQFGQFMGTPGYISPEQVDPNIRDVDTRTDVYSMGAILCVLLTGLLPFEAKRSHKPALDVWLRQLREQEPPPMSAKLASDPQHTSQAAAARSTDRKQLIRMLRGDLQWIVSKALERERERRYGSPAELAADLRRYVNDESVLARPQSAGYQLRKFIRRNRLATAVAGMLAVLALAAAAAGLIAVRKQHEAEFQAARVRQAQSRLLTQAAAQRLKDSDVAAAQGIILEVLRNPEFEQTPTPAAIHVFQDVRAGDAQIAVLAGHGSYVNAGVFSPDGTRVVTASDDKTARIWDARTGVEIIAIVGHRGYVNTATFSPDGARIVTASDDRTAGIWNARTGERIASLSGHGDVVESAIYSPDGSRIVTASDDQTARIWDARTGAQLTVLSGHTGYVYGAAYSPDDTRIVTASADRTARIWDAHTGAQLVVLAGHSGYVNAAAFSPDSARVVSVSEDNIARIWDAYTGAPLVMLSGHTGPIYCAAFSPDGKRIVTTSRDRTVRIWNALTGAQLAVFAGHRDRVSSGAYSPDGTRIITTSFDQTARIWDASIGHELVVLSHNGYVHSASYSPDGTRIVTGSGDSTSRIWDARTGMQIAVLTGHGDRVTSAVYSPDGMHLVTGSIDKSARIWDLSTGAQPRVLAASGRAYVMSGGYVYGVAYSPDGTRIATASTDQTARIWDASTGALVLVLSGHRGYVYGVAFSPDGTRIATASADKSARIWDARTGVQLAILSGHDDRVNSIAYSPDGTRIVTGSDDRTARVWDARSGLSIVVLAGHDERVNAARFSPDGRQIVTASADRSARIWDAQSGAQLAVLSGHLDSVSSAMYSPDASRIVTASGDKTVRVWDARVQGTLAAQILWYASAETDPLPQLDRTVLGLPADRAARSWLTAASACDQAAASSFDPDRLAPGNLREGIAVDIANTECAAEVAKPEHAARADYQMGRVLFARGDAAGARQELEIAAANHYRAAGVDLADLLVTASANGRDSDQAASLYAKAWREGVPIAGFRLGQFYEHRSHPDMLNAWQWYRRAADSGQPNALARFAERDERDSLDETDARRRNAHLLAAFALYAAAAELARLDDWPDDAWKTWRYRRATLARLLAREGMMQQVADAYAAVRSRWATRPPSLWERVQSAFQR